MRRTLQSIERLNEWIGRICSVTILAITAIVVYEVVLRYVFNSPTIWGFETTTMLYAFYFMIVGGYTLLHSDHVSVDFFYERLSSKGKAVLDIISYIVFFFPFTTVLLIYGYRFARDSWAIREKSWSVFAPPVYPVKTVIPVTALLLLIQGVAIFVRRVAILAGKGDCDD